MGSVTTKQDLPISAASDFRAFTVTPKPAWLTPASILLSDLVVLSLVSFTLVSAHHAITPKYPLKSLTYLAPYLAMLVPVFWMKGLYPGLLIHPAEEMRRIFHSFSIVFLMWAAITFILRTETAYSRLVFVGIWALGSPAVLICRHLTRRSLCRKEWWGVPAVLFGSGPAAQRITRKLRNGMLGIRVAGVFTEEQMLNRSTELSDRMLSPKGNRSVPQYAIIAMSAKTNLELSHVIQDHCNGFRHVLLVPDLPSVCSLGITPREIAGEVGLELPQRLFHRSAAVTKRLLDFVASGILLIALSPIFLIIMIAIAITSRGGVFFGQLRFGRKNQNFRAFKFRSMVIDADKRLADYLNKHPDQRSEWSRDHKLKQDPRVTAIGKWLRRYSLDELPQLFNVLIGQMSLVGPRPIVSAEIPKYGRGYDLYIRVLPGITGLWQVSGRNNTSYEERVSFDEFYVRNWSVWLDIYILIRTIKVVLTADGAY